MTTSIQPTAEDSRTNAVFEELMCAFSRPGVVRRLAGCNAVAMAQSLLDRECTYHVVDDAGLDMAIAATGARRASLHGADYVFAALGSAAAVGVLGDLRIGTLSYPDDAATLFCPATIGEGQRLRLTGPGIRESVTMDIGGIHPSFWAARERAIRYPLGWDLYLVDGERVIGIPRSTKIEVL